MKNFQIHWEFAKMLLHPSSRHQLLHVLSSSVCENRFWCIIENWTSHIHKYLSIYLSRINTLQRNPNATPCLENRTSVCYLAHICIQISTAVTLLSFMVSGWPSLAVINTMTGNNSGRKGVISAHSHSPSWREDRTGTKSWSLEAGIDAEAMKGYCLLALSSCFPVPPRITRSGTTSKRLGPQQ